MSRRGETMAEEMKKETEETVEETTKEEAEDYFRELTGKEPESWTIYDPIRNGSKYDDKYGFRIHK